MKPRQIGRPTYLSTLFKKYGIDAKMLVRAIGTTKEGARHWISGRSMPVALSLPSVVKLLQKYEPKLTIEALIARENVVARPRAGRGTRAGR